MHLSESLFTGYCLQEMDENVVLLELEVPKGLKLNQLHPSRSSSVAFCPVKGCAWF